ncbi:MAG: T9SS type A sorting domain-containing protein [Bacteroidetes bacterium]|nr:T9SS type A sorting domain-containing protein [Bacteroidota bacterium]
MNIGSKQTIVTAIVILLLNLFLLSTISAQTISTGAISGSPFCSGSSVSVPYSKTGPFVSGNVFTAQLSDASGSFTSPVSIGSVVSNTGGTIPATIPISTVSGTGYRIRVVSSNPPVTGSDNGTDLVIETTPSITDMTDTVLTNVGFSVTPINGIDGIVPTGTTYSWPAPIVTGGMTGGAASSGSPTSISGTLTNLTSTPQTATYTVTPTSGSCTGNTFTLIITVNPITNLYSYQTGNWDDPTTWTSDPSGNLQIGTAIPVDYNKVIILSGRTVYLQGDVNAQSLQIIINAGSFLDQGVHSFLNPLVSLSGQGTLKLASVNFPDVITNTFVNASGGTTEYNNASSFTLPATQTTYNNLTINTSGTVATQLSNITLNGNLFVKSGTFQINNNVSTVKLTLTINGNVNVDSGASIAVGNGVTNTSLGGSGGIAPFLNYYLNFHLVIIRGDFTNNGNVKFTNLPYPLYNAFPPAVAGPTSGAASVYFQGESNNTLTCNGITTFYNLIVDKGIDRTYKLTINSTSYENFRLFGANILANDLSLGTTPNVRKAFWIHAGTVILKGSLVIPSLTEGTAGNAEFYVPFNGALVVDGVDVVVLSTADDYREVNVAYNVSAPNNGAIGITKGGRSAVTIQGQLQINKGYFSTRESGGIITSNGSGKLILNGGILDSKQLLSATGSASYSQSGGLFILRGRFQRTPTSYTTVANLTDVSMATLNTTRAINGINADYGSFNLEQANNIFTQSGGTIRIYDVCGISISQREAFDVKSSASNINVTGGTLEIRPIAGSNLANSFSFLINTSAPLTNVLIDRVSSTSVVQLNGSPLIVQKDLNIASGDFSANNLDVTIGGDFFIGAGTSYTSGSNTTLLNGTGDQNLTVNLAAPLSFNKLTIDKPVGQSVELAGSQNTINVNDDFRLVLGTLNDNGKTINVSQDLYNSGLQTGTGKIVLNGTILQNIDGNGVFQNVELDNTNPAAAPISLLAGMTINGSLVFSQDRLFNIGIYNLRLNSSATIINAGPTRYIQTSGNAGDGGVTKVYGSVGSFTFPIGAPTISPSQPVKYTPATIGFSVAPATFGSVTVIPVGYEHPSTTIDGQSLTYFWRVNSSGFTGIVPNSVVHSFTYNQNDVVGTEANYIPALYTNYDFTWRYGTNTNPPIDITNNIITDWTTPSNSTDFLDGDYTAGDAAFGIPQVYYSRQTGLWGDLATWSLTGHTVTNPPAVPPGLNDVVIIGGQDSVYLATNNTIANTDVRSCASLQIEAGSALDIGYNFNSNFGIVQNHPNGNGNLRLTTSWTSGSTFTFPQGDYSDFNLNLGTTELYSTNPTAGTTYWLPNGILSYGNLILSPLGGSNIIFANNDLTIYGDLVTRGQNADSWFLPTWNVNYPTPPTVRIPKTITILGDMHIQGGALMWYGNGNIAQDFVINGDVIVETLSALYVWSGATNQSMAIGGSLINNTDGLTHGLTTRSKVDCSQIPLTFFGSSNASITNTTGNPLTTFSTVTIDKGSSQSTTLTCDIEGTLNTPDDNWLTLLNGTFRFMRTNPGTDFTISTTTAFAIPSTAGLYIDYTNANNREILIGDANNNNNDLLLSGKLTVINGDVYVGPMGAPANNNDIEYSGSGASAIEIQGGSLFVNGQIRRNTQTTNGNLKYIQSGGSVRINGNNANNDYAKLEVLNEGSSFYMSGGTLTIVRGGGISYGDLYIRPASSSVTGGTIIFTNVIPNSIQNYALDANIPLNNLTVTGASGAGVNANLNLFISPLELNGSLTLTNARSIFNSNDINVSIKGNLNNSGTYNYGSNTTTFNGGVQAISGSSITNFHNLYLSPTNSLTVNNDFTVNQDLSIMSGNLILGNKKITLYGNLTNFGSYNDDNTIGGIGLAGTIEQQISGTGSYGRLEINNIYGVKLNSDILIQNDLLLTQGIFDINSNLLTLSQNSNIIGTPDLTKMIMTEGVISSPGIRKFFTASPQSFTFPVGVLGKYTPAQFTISANGTVGYIKVSPINEFHPSVSDSTIVLNYYWKIESAGISGLDGDVLLQYIDSDVAGVESDYVAAKLELPGNIWSKAPAGSGTDNVDEVNHRISFYYAGISNLNGDYTAGESSAFPTEVSTYKSNSDGDWTDQSIWTPVGSSPPCPVGGPIGAIVIIDHIVTIDINDVSVISTTINETLRILAPTFGHSLGEVDGSGTMYVESGNIPSGDYGAFFDCSSGGTLEYGGTGIYTIIANQYNSLPNLFFTGTGTRILPNKDITVCNRLVIDGPTLDNSVNNYSLTILGSMERYNTGAFKSGSGSAPAATVSFAGTALQSLGGPTGDFTGVNGFNNLKINNESGLEIGLNGSVEVSNQLLLTNGIIHTTSTNKLIITNTSSDAVLPAGGSTSSYVDGPLIKRIINGDEFLYPLGKGFTKGHYLTLTSTAGATLLWTAEYFNPNPTATSLIPPLQAANTKEFWRVSTSTSASATIKLAWDRKSNLTPLMTPNGLADIRVAEFNSGSWSELPSFAAGNDYNGDVVTTNNIPISTIPKNYTIASIAEITPRASLLSDEPVCGESGIPVGFAYYEPISLNYSLDYTIDGIPQPTIAVTSLPYTLPTPFTGVYQLTNFTFNNGANTGVVDTTTVSVYDPPMNADAGEDQSLCGVSGTVLEGNDPGPYSGLWTIISGSGGVLIDNSFNSTVFTGSLGETYTLRWTISNVTCTSSDEVIISFPVIAGQPLNFTSAPTPVCQGSTDNVYTVPSAVGVTYNWSYSGTGATINGTGNSITIDFDLSATSGTLSVTASNACGTSPARTVDITVTPLPVATFSYTGTPYFYTDPNPFPTFSGGGTAGTFTSTAGLVFVSSATGEVDLAGSTPGTYIVTNTIDPIGGCGTVSETSPITIYDKITWTGDVSTDWNVASNWSYDLLPELTKDALIPDVPNKPVLSSGINGTVKNITIESGSSLTITANTLEIAGSITNGGTFDATSGTIELKGSSAQTISAGQFTGNTIDGLIVNNVAGVTLLGPLNVTGIVAATSGNLTSDGNLTLISTAIQTALIDGAGTGEVTGDVTMQRYLPSGFGYKYFSSPFQAATVGEFDDDMDLAASFPTFYEYDENVVTSGWDSYVNVVNPLIPLSGYAINFGPNAAAKTVDVAGVVNNGPLSRIIYNHNHPYTQGFNLFGNPYPSPIDWDAASGWTKSNIDNALYYFKAGGADQYSGTYSTYINGISSDGLATNIIPSMQGFFIHVTDGVYPVAGTLGMNNSVRVNDLSHPFLKTTENSNKILLRFTTSYSDNPSSSDPMVIYFDENATPDFDSNFDALKLMNTDEKVTNFYAILPDGTKLSIDALPEIIDPITTIPLGLINYQSGQVSFRIRDYENLIPGMKIYLHDAATGVNQDLLEEPEYKINLDAGEYLNRFSIKVLDGTTNLPDIDQSDFFNIYFSNGKLNVNSGYLGNNDGVLSLYDMAGRKLFSQRIMEKGMYHFDPHLSNGIYVATLLSGNEVKTKKILIEKK